MTSNRFDNDPSTEMFRKLFIGGLSINTDEEMLRSHFEQWGQLIDVVVMRIGGKSGKSRGFGFVTYKEPEMLDEAQSNRPHVIADRTVETKRAMPRDEASSAEAHMTTNKLFVGALKKNVTADDLRDYFGGYGSITECDLIKSRETGESRGFGFVTFDDYDSVDKVLLHKPHHIDDKRCEVKKAISKEEARAMKTKETSGNMVGNRNHQQHTSNDKSGFMNDIRNRLNTRLDHFGYQNDNNDRFGRYNDERSYNEGPIRGHMNYNDDRGYSGGQIRGNVNYNDDRNYNGEPIRGSVNYNDDRGYNGGPIRGNLNYSDDRDYNGGPVRGNVNYNDDRGYSGGPIRGSMSYSNNRIQPYYDSDRLRRNY